MDDHFENMYGIPPVFDPHNITGFDAPLYLDDRAQQNHVVSHQAFYDDGCGMPALDRSMTEASNQDSFLTNWAIQTPGAHGHRRQQSNASTSAASQSSFNTRYSNNSIFSQHLGRDSFASSNTNWSQYSAPDHDSTAASAGRPASHTTLDAPSLDPAIETHMQYNRLIQPVNPQQGTTKVQYVTCMSRTKRTRRSTKGEPRYFCTSCHEGFREKYDWKRHEETYQERSETFLCDLCTKTYFLEKDFVHHHREGHRCRKCLESAHVELARRKRRARTGWGCGFCEHFSFEWTERCNHIAKHFESGLTMSSWNHTYVILSLLQQPCLKDTWLRLLESKREFNPSFHWSRRWSGRAEGYPDGDRQPQLQDLLEFFTPDQDAGKLVFAAYDAGHREKGLNKELPPLPPTGDAFMPWNSLMSTIVEDNSLAHGLDFHLEEYVPR